MSRIYLHRVFQDGIIVKIDIKKIDFKVGN